jgi:hypothetical protein
VFSGVLISPRHVLTAAHVVAGRNPDEIAFNLNAGSELPQQLRAAHVFIHPAYTGAKSNTDQINHNDLAIVELAEAAPPEAPVYPILAQPIPPGTIITFVGYGAGGDGVHGVTAGSNASIKRVGANRVEQLLPNSALPDKRDVYLFRFHGPDRGSQRAKPKGRFGGTLGNNVEATLAVGDSGSPAFVRIPLGGWHLVGINTFVIGFPGEAKDRNKFGNGGGGMLLYPQLAWIDRFIKGAR